MYFLKHLVSELSVYIVSLFAAYESSSSGLTLIQQRSPVVKVLLVISLSLVCE